MRTYRWAAAMTAVMAIVVGCEQHGGEGAAGGGGKVAIVDMDRIARETGRAKSMEAEFKKREGAHIGDLEKLRQMVNAQVANQRQRAATQPAEADRLQQVYAEAQAAMQQRQMQMGDDLERFHRDLTNRFRQEVAPVAKRVAELHGMTVVLAKDDRLLSFDATSDITSDVIAEMQRSSPAASFGSGAPVPAAPGESGSPDASRQPPVPAPTTSGDHAHPH